MSVYRRSVVVLSCVLGSACTNKGVIGGLDDTGSATTGMDAGGSDAGGSDAGGSDAGGSDGGGSDGGGSDGGGSDGGMDGGTVDPDLQFDLTGDYADTTLTLTWLDPSTLDGKGGSSSPDLGDVLWSGAVSGAVTSITLDPPGSDQLIELGPSTQGAFYVSALHHDLDGDDLRSGDEVFVGVGQWWVVWMDGKVSAPWSDYGLVSGWNALRVDGTGGGPDPKFELGDPLAMPLDTALTSVEDVSLDGSFGGSMSGDIRLGLLPGPLFDGGTVDAWLVDQAMTNPWAVDLSGPPPDDHFTVDKGGLATAQAIEVPMSFLDMDHSGSFSDGDLPQNLACAGDAAVALVYLPGATDLWLGMVYGSMGLHAGWIPMELSDTGGEPVFIDESLLSSLVIDSSCPFPS